MYSNSAEPSKNQFKWKGGEVSSLKGKGNLTGKVFEQVTKLVEV